MQPFEGIKVLDLTHVFAGPFCTYQLSVMGADVIKIESPDLPDMSRSTSAVPEWAKLGVGTSFATQGSNKRGLSLNLKTGEGRAILKKLVASADVLVENYRAGAMEGLGLGWSDLQPLNPRLIYCSMTGFGQNGPKRGHVAFDNVIQAVSGLMSITGTPETAPVKAGGAVLDYGTGAMAAYAVSCALFQRSRTGVGQRIDVAMMDAAFMLMSATMCEFLNSGRDPKPLGRDTDNPTYSCHETKDGLLMLGAGKPYQQRRLFDAIGRPELMERVPTMTREALTDELRATLREKTADEWVAILNAAHVPAERVRTIREALDHPQVKHRQVFHTHPDAFGPGKDLTVPVAAFTFEHGGPSARTRPPRIGEHTDQILAELGYNSDEIAGLREARVV